MSQVTWVSALIWFIGATSAQVFKICTPFHNDLQHYAYPFPLLIYELKYFDSGLQQIPTGLLQSWR